MKQTAVEWLINEWLYLDSEFDMMLIDKKIYWERLREKHNQAKEMEKQQIMDAYLIDGYTDLTNDYWCIEFEEYYNETYKNGNK